MYTAKLTKTRKLQTSGASHTICKGLKVCSIIRPYTMKKKKKSNSLIVSQPPSFPKEPNFQLSKSWCSPGSLRAIGTTGFDSRAEQRHTPLVRVLVGLRTPTGANPVSLRCVPPTHLPDKRINFKQRFLDWDAAKVCVRILLYYLFILQFLKVLSHQRMLLIGTLL